MVRAEIDLNELEKLATLHATDAELGAWFGVSTRTIERRKLEPEFAEAIERGRANGKLNLRRNQMKMAETNPAMAIWLGKNLLGQADRVVAEARVIWCIDDLTSEEMEAMTAGAKRQRELLQEQAKSLNVIPATSEPVNEAPAQLPGTA